MYSIFLGLPFPPPQARVPDPSRVLVEVGLGFFVELGLAEARDFAQRRATALEARAERLTRDACKVRTVSRKKKMSYTGCQEFMGSKVRCLFCS